MGYSYRNEAGITQKAIAAFHNGGNEYGNLLYNFATKEHYGFFEADAVTMKDGGIRGNCYTFVDGDRSKSHHFMRYYINGDGSVRQFAGMLPPGIKFDDTKEGSL